MLAFIPFSILSLVSCMLLVAASPFVSSVNANEESYIGSFYNDGGSLMELDDRVLVDNGGQLLPVASVKTHRIENRAAKQRFCGDHLINALALVCKGNYKKRTSVVPPFSSEVESLDSMSSSSYQSKERFGSKQSGDTAASELFEILKNANSYHVPSASSSSSWTGHSNKVSKSGKSRPKRGVVDECCKNACSTVTLAQYCGE